MKLVVPRGHGVRPTADRVREALFSSLGSVVRGARTLDLFAGSGALGLEALSRGADLAVFVDRSRHAQGALLRNISRLGFDSKATLIREEALTALSLLANDGALFDLIFLDPPYSGRLMERTLSYLADSKIVAPGATIVAEHSSDAPPVLPECLRALSTRRYGGTSLTMIMAAIER